MRSPSVQSSQPAIELSQKQQDHADSSHSRRNFETQQREIEGGRGGELESRSPPCLLPNLKSLWLRSKTTIPHPSSSLQCQHHANIGGNVQNAEFTATFDFKTTFTYLNDPAYALITESFDKLALDKRDTSLSDSGIPFGYCYDLRAKETNITYLVMKLTMKGGDPFSVNDPIANISTQDGGVYCLGIIKSDDVNIIGQNFMTGYQIVFNKENMVLGWTTSDCNDVISSINVPLKAPTAPAKPPAAARSPFQF